MASSVPLISLNDGNTIPQLGFGVWQIDNAEVAGAVLTAIETGYRLIDTAQGYDNEEGVGEAVRRCGLPREQLFITSKLRTRDQPYEAAIRSFEGSLKRLGLDYLDMFLIHWPVPRHEMYPDAWRAFVKLQEQGKVRSIGVSNFMPEHIERVVDETGVTPAVNQIEVHPEYQQQGVREFHRQHNIAIESYSPLGAGAVLDNPTIREIAQRHGREPAQAILRWHIQQGLIVIPKSVNPDRIRSNFQIFDFELDDRDLRDFAVMDRPDGKQGENPATNNTLW